MTAAPAEPISDPSGAPDHLFSYLDTAHIEMQRHLLILRGLASRITERGIDSGDLASIADLIRFFNEDAHQHHLDEEEHIFPALLASHNREIVQVVQHLFEDHGWLEEDWREIAPFLQAAADGNNNADPEDLRHAIETFETLYHDHMLLEESFAYPEARKRVPDEYMAALQDQMALRRAARKALDSE